MLVYNNVDLWEMLNSLNGQESVNHNPIIGDYSLQLWKIMFSTNASHWRSVACLTHNETEKLQLDENDVWAYCNSNLVLI